jgi:hypothetical protein
VLTILPQKGKWFSQSEVILSPLNFGKDISPTGTVKGTPLTVPLSGLRPCPNPLRLNLGLP